MRLPIFETPHVIQNRIGWRQQRLFINVDSWEISKPHVGRCFSRRRMLFLSKWRRFVFVFRYFWNLFVLWIMTLELCEMNVFMFSMCLRLIPGCFATIQHLVNFYLFHLAIFGVFPCSVFAFFGNMIMQVQESCRCDFVRVAGNVCCWHVFADLMHQRSFLSFHLDRWKPFRGFSGRCRMLFLVDCLPNICFNVFHFLIACRFRSIYDCWRCRNFWWKTVEILIRPNR